MISSYIGTKKLNKLIKEEGPIIKTFVEKKGTYNLLLKGTQLVTTMRFVTHTFAKCPGEELPS